MKRKFLSFALCLSLCLTSMVFFSACKEKPEAVSEVDAAQELSVAMEAMETAEAVKIYSKNFMFMGDVMIISTAEESYTSMGLMNTEAWIKTEGNNLYEYSIVDIGEGKEELVYTKKLVVEGIENDGMDDVFDLFEESVFSKASKLDGVMTIDFKIQEEGSTVVMSFKIKSGTLQSISIKAGSVSTTIHFEFGAHLVDEIPAMPTGVVWNEYQPFIEVDGIDTQYNVGDTLDLEDIVIEYYEDIETDSPEEFDITEDMITGFTTETAGTRTMTITFYGLTFNVEYTVTEPAAE